MKQIGIKKKKRVKHSGASHCIVKRGRERLCFGYDEKKVYASAYAACSAVQMGERECERIGDETARNVTKFVRGKKTVSSGAIAAIVVRELKKRNKDAAFMYETHRDVS